MTRTATPITVTEPAGRQAAAESAVDLILTEYAQRRPEGGLVVDGRLDGDRLADLFENYRQGRYAADAATLAMLELAEALYAHGSYVDLREVLARLAGDPIAVALAARALTLAATGTDPLDVAREAVRWTDENTPIGVVGPVRRLAATFGATRR